MLFGTTSESPTVEPEEQRAVVAAAIELAAGALPIHVGLSGNSTRHVAKAVASYESLAVDGHLVVTPYYDRPGNDRIVEHFRVAASETGRTIIVYNVPYRTGVNLSNDALIELAASVPTIQGRKDSTGDTSCRAWTCCTARRRLCPEHAPPRPGFGHLLSVHVVGSR